MLPRPSTAAVVEADPGQLDQIVLNRAVNARDVMAHGGKFIIETGVFDLDEGFCSRSLHDARPLRHACGQRQRDWHE